jgi:hypothetical protein
MLAKKAQDGFRAAERGACARALRLQKTSMDKFLVNEAYNLTSAVTLECEQDSLTIIVILARLKAQNRSALQKS